MGYASSKQTVRRVEPLLKQMVEADGLIEFPSDHPSKLAYHIRDGIKSAKIYATDNAKQIVEPYATYAQLEAKYKIRVNSGKVTCEPRDFIKAIKSTKESLGALSIPEASSTLDVIGAAIKHKADEMIFPDANSETIEADRVYAWAEKNGYYLIAGGLHVTLTKTDPGELAWKPQI